MSKLAAEVHDALDYLLSVVGDNTVEGEAAKLRSALRQLDEREVAEGEPAKVSDEQSDPRELARLANLELEAAQAKANAANAAAQPYTPPAPVVSQGLKDADVASNPDPGTPAPSEAPPAAPVEAAPVTDSSAVPAPPQFSA